MTAAVDISSLSLTERKHMLWRAGRLDYLLRPHQREAYEQFHRYQNERSNPDARQRYRDVGAKWPELFVFGVARRWGKSTLALLLLIEQAIRRPGSDFMLCTAYQASIGSIFLKIVREVFAPEAPEGYAPVYHRSANGLGEHLHIPAVNSTIRLVGLDLNPERSRGNSLDGCLISEVSFMDDKLVETYQSVIVPQYRGRPHAFTIMESSFAYSADHCFHSTFAEDAAKRGAYVEKTIYESGLSEQEIEDEISKCGGRESATAKRELLCQHAIDRDRAIAPNFSARNLVPADFPVPQYGFGVVGFDPGGWGDAAGIVFALVDPSAKRVIVQASAALRATTTDELADFIRATERDLWGTRAETVVQPKRTLREMLQAPRDVPRTDTQLETLSIDNLDDSTVTIDGQVWDAPPDSVTYWDDLRWSLRPNPWRRLSDAAPQQLADLRQRHGLRFEVPTKGRGNMVAQMDLLNSFLHDGSLLILDNEANEELVKQLRSGRWDKKHNDLERSATLGHLDTAVALSIALRGVDFTRDARRPLHVDNRPGPGVAVPPAAQRALREVRDLPTFSRLQPKKYR